MGLRTIPSKVWKGRQTRGPSDLPQGQRPQIWSLGLWIPLLRSPRVMSHRPQATTQAGEGWGAGAGLHSPEDRRTEIWTEPRLSPVPS